MRHLQLTLAIVAATAASVHAAPTGALTPQPNVERSTSNPLRDEETLKIVFSGAVSAHFKGTRELPAPLEHSVTALWFEFEGDERKYAFTPTGNLHATDWSFDVFSQDGSFVLLPQDHRGPYHVVRVGHLKDYLVGARGADEIIGGARGTDTAAVHGDAQWLSDTELRYTTTRDGETLEHRHSIRFLDYRPKRSPDTVFDYRPALSLEAAALPEFDAGHMGDLVSEMERLIAAARNRPGRFESGKVALGANPQEYVPSDEELLAARFGDAFVDLLNRLDAGQIEAPRVQRTARTLIYHRFIYRHVDVIGSGRYFYSSPPIPTVLEIDTSGD